MLGNLIRGIFLMSACLIWPGVFEFASWCQQPMEIKDNPSQTIVQIDNYSITIKDLEQIINAYPEGSISSRESKVRLLESVITTKIFSLAARSAKLDTAEGFSTAKAKARQSVLAYAYYQRYVKPKFSDEEARKYFETHKDEFPNFLFSRSRIIALLKDQALTATNQSLMQKFGVKQRDDLLKDLDLRHIRDTSIVLAQIGDAVVTTGDLGQLATLYPMQDFSVFGAKKELLDTLVLERLYALAAKNAGMVNDPEVQKAFEWSENKLLETQYTHLVEGKVTLEDARQYYQAHPEEFRLPDQLWLRKIVVTTQEEAQAVKAKLDQGNSFEEVAKTFSLDRASAMQGGNIGWIRKGMLHPEVESVVFQLSLNQISQPIKTSDGYYLVRIDKRLEGAVRSFEQVSANLLLRLKTRAIEAERKRLMAAYKVIINEALL